MIRRFTARTLQFCTRTCDAAIEHLGDARRVSAFLRGRMEFRARPDDVYVVTYPRSGTTWMQYMLHLLLHGLDQEFRHISEVSPWFERSLAVGSLQAEDLEGFPAPRIFKSHLNYGWIPKIGRKIYIERDGADVLTSYYHFYRSHLGFEGSFEDFFDHFARGRLQYGSWFKHVAGWHRHRDDPDVLWLRYEDLVECRGPCLERIAHFCGTDASPERIEAVLRRSTFAAMKPLEQKFDHTTVVLMERGMRPRSFIREGKTGSGATTLTQRQRRELARLKQRSWSHPEIELDLPAFLH